VYINTLKTMASAFHSLPEPRQPSSAHSLLSLRSHTVVGVVATNVLLKVVLRNLVPMEAPSDTTSLVKSLTLKLYVRERESARVEAMNQALAHGAVAESAIQPL
jgi:hypothetical protein